MRYLLLVIATCGIAIAQGSTPGRNESQPLVAPSISAHIALPDKLVVAYWKAHSAALAAQSTEQAQITAMQLECAKQHADLMQDPQSAELYCQSAPVTAKMPPKENK